MFVLQPASAEAEAVVGCQKVLEVTLTGVRLGNVVVMVFLSTGCGRYLLE